VVEVRDGLITRIDDDIDPGPFAALAQLTDATVRCSVPAVGKVLSAEQVDRFERDGWLAPIPVMSADDAQTIRERLEDEERRLGGPLAGARLQKPHLVYPWLADLVFHGTVVDAVEDLYGPDLFCWSSTLFAKEAHTGSFVSWHQDSTYWGLSRPDVVTAWVALTPSTAENGALEVVSGTHQLDQLPHRDTFAADNMLSRGQEIAVDVGNATPSVIELQPGEMSLHHVRLVHGSAPNRSDDRRIGFAMRFIPTSVAQLVGERDSATLVRGEDRFDHFDHEPRCTAEHDPAMLALHQQITEKSAARLYRGTDVTTFDRPR
jgi:non-heme Fe2+,alpha-ketoglutarate-dependent halogenase